MKKLWYPLFWAVFFGVIIICSMVRGQTTNTFPVATGTVQNVSRLNWTDGSIQTSAPDVIATSVFNTLILTVDLVTTNQAGVIATNTFSNLIASVSTISTADAGVIATNTFSNLIASEDFVSTNQAGTIATNTYSNLIASQDLVTTNQAGTIATNTFSNLIFTTMTGLETRVGGTNIITEQKIDTIAELDAIVADLSLTNSLLWTLYQAGTGGVIRLGSGNTNSDSSSLILGGTANWITSAGDSTAIVAGENNINEGDQAFIGAGENNKIEGTASSADFSAIVAGQNGLLEESRNSFQGAGYFLEMDRADGSGQVSGYMNFIGRRSYFGFQGAGVKNEVADFPNPDIQLLSTNMAALITIPGGLMNKSASNYMAHLIGSLNICTNDSVVMNNSPVVYYSGQHTGPSVKPRLIDTNANFGGTNNLIGYTLVQIRGSLIDEDSTTMWVISSNDLTNIRATNRWDIQAGFQGQGDTPDWKWNISTNLNSTDFYLVMDPLLVSAVDGTHIIGAVNGVGINTNNPAQALHVNGNAMADQFWIGTNGYITVINTTQLVFIVPNTATNVIDANTKAP